VKDLIYLDTDYIHSFISQIEGGLPTNIDLETGEEIAEENELQTGSGRETTIGGKLTLGELEIPLVFKAPSGELSASIKPTITSSERISLSQLESGREIISKKLHDDALKRFEEYMEEAKLFKTSINNVKQGEFIKIESHFQIVDFNFMKKAFDPEKILSFVYHDQEENLKQLKEKVSELKNGKERNLARAQLRELENKILTGKKNDKNVFTFLKISLEYMLDFLPTATFLLAENLLVPLKQKFLRESSKDLTFKYGSKNMDLKIVIVGKITRQVTGVTLPDFSQEYSFLEFGEVVNYLLKEIGVLQKNNFIVSPIAIYFE